jgi:VCBS repeat protein
MKKSLCVLLCSAAAILATSSAPAQTFTQSEFGSAGQRVFGIKSADVNNDGKLDLIGISDPNEPSSFCAGNPNGETSRDIVVHLGNGDGSFGSPTVLHSQSCWGSDSVVEVEILDVNKDAKPDLVYAGGDTLGIMLGNGDGTFQAPTQSHVGTEGLFDGITSLGVADFNNDGNIDFVVSTYRYLQFFYGNGEGSVGQPALLDLGDPVPELPGTFDVEAGDINHDGNADVIFVRCCDWADLYFNGNYSYVLYAHLGDGRGNFADEVGVDGFYGVLGSLQISDLNGDGFADIIGIERFGDGIGPATELNHGDSTFIFKWASVPTIQTSVTLGDFDRDGTVDLVTNASPGILIWPRAADGTILTPREVDIDPAPTDVGDVIAGDFNNDGNPDIAAVVDLNKIAVLTSKGCNSCDTTAPDTVITYAVGSSGAPLRAETNGPTLATSVVFGFTGSDDVGVTGFQCRMDAAAFAACSSPASYSGLALGEHVFEVRAIDASGNRDATPAQYSILIVSGPDTTITSVVDGAGVSLASGATTSSTSMRFAFSGSDNAGIVGFECRLDSAAFSTCNSPATYTGLSVGSHQFAVRAIDGYGFTDASPATFAFTVTTAPPDTTAPETVITSAADGNGAALPNGGTTLATVVNFTFTGTDNVAVTGFECRVDAAVFTACSSSATYSGLALGGHFFEVRAFDAAGNRDLTPARLSFVIDAAPDTAITSVVDGSGAPIANGAVTLSNAATFAFSGSDNVGVARFECRLDGATFATCASPVSYSSLSLGTHQFAARAVDTSGFVDPTPATFVVTIDASPDSTILSAADNTGRAVANGGSMRGSSITFRFSGTDNNAVAGFECSRDNAAFAQCTSPATYSVTPGSHTFRIRAVDNAGFRDPTPATFSWTK